MGFRNDRNATASTYRIRLFTIALASSLTFLASAQWADAQLTVEKLIGSIVADPTAPRYGDVAAAIEEFMQGNVEGTQTMLAEAVDNNPDLPPADTLLATMFFNSGDARAARGALERATEKVPGDPEAFLLLGDVALAERRLTEAELLYARANQLCAAYAANPRRKQRLQIGAYSGISAVAAARQRWNAAASAIEAWLELDPASIDAQRRWARVLVHRGELEQAYAVLQKAHEQNPQSVRPEVTMGLLYEELVRLGDGAKHESARRAMQAALQRDPNSLETQLAVARWGLETCEIEIAATSAKAAQLLDAKSLEAKFMVGLVERHRGNLAAAVAAFESAHLQAPGDSAVINQLAVILSEQKDDAQLQQAMEYARLNLSANPDRGQPGGPDAAVTMAWVLHQSGRNGEALRAVQAAVASGPVSDDGAYYAAVILAAGGEGGSARNLLRPAVDSGRCFVTKSAARKLLDQLAAGE